MRLVPGVIVRQALVGLVMFLLSLALLSLVQRAMGLGAPPRGGVILVGISVVFAWVSGGMLGTAIGAAAHARRFHGAPLIALLAGLVWGGVVCTTVVPLYIDSALESLARQGVGHVLRERQALLNRETGVQSTLDAAKTLAWSGAGHLPALSLLLWSLLGPAIAGGLEARRARSR